MTALYSYGVRENLQRRRVKQRLLQRYSFDVTIAVAAVVAGRKKAALLERLVAQSTWGDLYQGKAWSWSSLTLLLMLVSDRSPFERCQSGEPALLRASAIVSRSLNHRTPVSKSEEYFQTPSGCPLYRVARHRPTTAPSVFAPWRIQIDNP